MNGKTNQLPQISVELVGEAIRYDVRGIGKSSRPTGPFSHGDDLHGLLEFLGVKRAHVVALSVGGAIAIDFTLGHPDFVDHLILAASGLSDDAKAQANMQGRSMLADMTKKQGLEQVIPLILDAPFVITKENTAAREKIRTIYLENRDVFENGFPLYSLWQPVQPPASARLSEIHTPTLIIRGDKDNPAYIALTDKVGRGINSARTVIIPGGTHFINLDKPKEFNRAVLQFLGVSSS
ncbi:MAG: alpha/beta hydrolase [Pyrinomonadaceae bacterium]|nr:alpha/beta hydrolase [Pyrinomonadaceae bacterium]